MTQYTPDQMAKMAEMAAQWLGKSGFDAKKAQENARPTNEYWAPKNGTTVFRLLPPGKDNCALFKSGWWTARYFKYWLDIPRPGVAASGKKEAIIAYDGRRCAPDTFQTDPIGEAIEESSSSLSAEVVKSLRSKARCLANVLVKEIYDERGSAVNDPVCGRVVVADLPIGFHDHIRNDFANPTMGVYANPFSGLDIILRRTGKGVRDTEYAYGIRPGVAPSPLYDDMNQILKVLNELPDLTQLILANCQRDADKVKEGAELIRAYAQSLRQTSAFAPGFTPPSFGPPPGFTPPQMPQMPAQAPALPVGGQWTPPPPPAVAPQITPAPISHASTNPSQAVPTAWVPPMSPAAVQPAAPAPAQPQQTLSRPGCYKEFVKKNGTADSDAAKDASCLACAYRIPCAFESSL